MDIETELKDICKRMGLTYIRHIKRDDLVIETHVTRVRDGAWGILKHSAHELSCNELERKLRTRE